jgi:adenylate cyclase
MKSKILAKLTAGVLLGLAAAVLIWILARLILPDLFYAFEARTYDSRMSIGIQGTPEQSIEDIIIIDIDGRSVSKLGKFYQWPRSYYPRVIRFMNEGGALAIGVDILLDKDMRQPDADQDLIHTVRQSGNIFNSIYFENEDSLSWRYKMEKEPSGLDWQRFVYFFPPSVTERFRQEERIGSEFIELMNASHGIGHVNFQGDVDGVVRKIHLFSAFNEHAYPALAFKMFLDLTGIDSISVHLGEKISLFSEGHILQEIPIDDNGNMLINYAGQFKTFRYISFYDVLEQRLPKEYFRNKIVFIGTSLAGLFDLRAAPFSPSFPGVEIHANILNTLLTGDFIIKLSETQAFVSLAVLCGIVGIVIVFLSPLWSIIVIVVVAALNTFIAYHVFWEYDFWIPMVNPLLGLVLTFSLIYIYKYVTEERGKKFIKNTFSYFVTQSVVDELLANPDKIKLGGEKKECSVLFSDVSGFTTIAEQLTPDALVRLLNEYLTQMTNIVFKYDGMLDKYEGDAIMAVFGAPISQEDHAIKACSAALEMQEQLVKLRELWGKQGRPQLHARCGINSGLMVVGNMGSENRFDYTVMGDAVNLGARLEPANKQYKTWTMIGENTFNLAKNKVIVRELDLLRVKGKTEPVKVYELIALREKGITDKKQQMLALFAQGFNNYLRQNWEDAYKLFQQALTIEPNDGPSRVYIQRTSQFAKNPPPKDWDGVFTMRSK